MDNQKIITGIILDETTEISFRDVCEKYHVPEAWLLEMAEQGLFNLETNDLEYLRFDYSLLRRIQSAYRLQHDLGINTSGIALVMELLEELEEMRKELRILQRYVDFS